MIGPQSRGFVFLLGALMMVNVLSIDMTLPALPALGTALSATPDQIQLTLSLYLVGYAAGQVVIGPLSDRFGRRRVLVSGLAVYSLATLACAASPGIGILIAARLFQGVSACGGPGHGAGDRARPLRRGSRGAHDVVPYYRVRCGAVAGADNRRRAARALWLAFDLPVHRLLVSRPACRRLGFTRGVVARARPAGSSARAHPCQFTAPSSPPARRSDTQLNGLCSLGMFAFLSGSPFVLIEIYGVAPDHYGYYFGLSALTLMLFVSTNKRLLRRMPGERVMRYGFLILAIGGAAAVAIPFSPLNGPFALTAAIMIYVFGQMLVQPNAVAAALLPLRHMAGTGSALMGMMQMLFGALGGYVVNALYDGTPLPMTGTLLVAGLACGGLSLLLKK
jgi:DHA1 family bicyclomycin/chloramphenicol resistance-like MFS transporter